MVEKEARLPWTQLSRNLAARWSRENANWRIDVESKEFLLFFEKFLCLNAVIKGRN